MVGRTAYLLVRLLQTVLTDVYADDRLDARAFLKEGKRIPSSATDIDDGAIRALVLGYPVGCMLKPLHAVFRNMLVEIGDSLGIFWFSLQRKALSAPHAFLSALGLGSGRRWSMVPAGRGRCRPRPPTMRSRSRKASLPRPAVLRESVTTSAETASVHAGSSTRSGPLREHSETRSYSSYPRCRLHPSVDARAGGLGLRARRYARLAGQALRPDPVRHVRGFT